MEVQTRKRGRPVGSVKADHRQKRNYRLSPATMRLIEQGKQLTDSTETAFIEAAIQHYMDALTAQEPDNSEQERPVLHFPGVTSEQVAELVERPALPAMPIPAMPAAQAPALATSSHLPTYQIYMRHSPGACPDLPQGFDYLDQDRNAGKRRCMNPVHRVFTQPCTIKSAEQRADTLEKAAGIVSVWIEDKTGKHSWKKESEHWRRND
jgi:hypothetical protein